MKEYLNETKINKYENLRDEIAELVLILVMLFLEWECLSRHFDRVTG